MLFIDSHFQANPLYVLWVTNVCLMMIFAVACINVVLPFGNVPIIFEKINKNQLAIFLIANLGTGLVNLSIDTLAQSDTVAFWIIGGYVFIVSILAELLSSFRIKL